MIVLGSVINRRSPYQCFPVSLLAVFVNLKPTNKYNNVSKEIDLSRINQYTFIKDKQYTTSYIYGMMLNYAFAACNPAYRVLVINSVRGSAPNTRWLHSCDGL